MNDQFRSPISLSFFFRFFFDSMRKSCEYIFFLSLFRVELKETRKRIRFPPSFFFYEREKSMTRKYFMT